jgi:hypothetical protein
MQCYYRSSESCGRRSADSDVVRATVTHFIGETLVAKHGDTPASKCQDNNSSWIGIGTLRHDDDR